MTEFHSLNYLCIVLLAFAFLHPSLKGNPVQFRSCPAAVNLIMGGSQTQCHCRLRWEGEPPEMSQKTCKTIRRTASRKESTVSVIDFL